MSSRLRRLLRAYYPWIVVAISFFAVGSRIMALGFVVSDTTHHILKS